MGIRWSVTTSVALALCTVILTPPALAEPPVPRANYYLTPTEMLDIYGVYRLDNGEVLRISREARRYWAESASGKVELLPVASILFVARDGSRQFAFTPQAFGTELQVGPPSPAVLATLGPAR